MGKMGEIAADISALDVAFDLTAFMQSERILRIARNPHGFSVALEGDCYGTGLTVGEAFDNAVRQRRLAA